MSKIFRKNQLMITALAIMIAVAGYLNFSGKEILLETDQLETMAGKTEDEIEIPDGEIGEAILTSASVENFVTEIRLNREQSFSLAKDNLNNVIQNTSLSQEEKQGAVDQLVLLSKRVEMQTAAEELLAAKGFLYAVVTVGEEGVDVAVASQDLSSVAKAQIEDAVARTCGCDLSEIVITKMKINK